MSKKDFLTEKISGIQQKWSEVVADVKAIDLQNWRESKGLLRIAQGTGVLVVAGALIFTGVHGASFNSMSGAAQVAEDQNAMTKACRIVIDGQPVFIAASREEAEKIVKDAIDYFSVGQISSPGVEVVDVKVKQKITYEDVEVPKGQVQTAADIKKLLVEGKGEKVRYVVQQGDTLWSVATKNNMSWLALIKTNPQLADENKLKIGQEINLNRPTYYLNVATTYKSTVQEDIPYPTKVEKSDDVRPGGVTVKQEGVRGTKLATYLLTKENNYLVEQNLTEEKVLKEPVQRLEVRGNNRVQLASRGTSRARGTYSGGGSGTLSWPVAGHRITSGFGYRGGREFHPAIDIDLETGDPVYAAADGTVVSAGWAGNYGKCIIIDHGGMTTRYAHLSSIEVGEGQTVSRGSEIGKGGATGRAYGSHLHFEVNDGGVKNPLNYLN
ncbi:peptidoglycan DD-metalloendopeptidase family protein [Heliobacterium chlorum]|uniref:Peptidoglycan DD-metalloendopeptidase family protein n=1 Tax=Heliobacterium chlorum TaxID=2698 RepID=A0ABR7T7W3_HELCL|nr:peptidoglycan DD-metalloendopeptidase family protein [Heliobacterium chlorum]MBC9786202.1 peptidoglycan DD-metalloendopeptidase family protein [Heliobacterium chlorum]